MNRCPDNLDEMIKTINAADDINDKWIMCSPEKARFHMFGETGAYNIKFISSNNTDNIYEAVYDKDGNLIAENDDNGKNMGTYNYASSSKDAGNHTKYDVKTYEELGNTPSDPKPIKDSWDKNVVQNLAFGLAGYYEPYKKGSHWYDLDKVDRDAQKHYTEVCEAIGIKYDKLLKNIFSDACY